MLAQNPFPDAEDLGAITLDNVLNIHAPSVYLVRISGDSMEGAGIFHDTVVVDRTFDVRSGQIVIAAVSGEPLCTRLRKDGRQIILLSENPQFAPRYILEGDEFSVWGVVAHSLRSHGPWSCIS